MRPTLLSLRLGGQELGLHTYGLLVATGIAVGVVLIWREGRRQGFDGGRLLDLCFWGLVLGLAGSRVAYVALHARDFADACASSAGGRLWGCTAALRFWEGGLVFYGGMLASGAAVLAFCRRERWSFWRLGDLVAPSVAIGHVLGRLGCLAAGCCFGKACALPWGLRFGPGSVAFEELASMARPLSEARTPPLHPTQLYEAAGELAIFVALLVARRRPQRPGALVLGYAAAYAALRFCVEIFRGDPGRRLIVAIAPARLAAALGLPPSEPLFLSTSQLGSLIVLAVVAVALWRRRRTPADPPPATNAR